MKKYCLLSMLLCALLCLAVANTAFGETQTSAKQLFLTDLNNNGIKVIGLPFQSCAGTSVVEIKKFETNLPDLEEIGQLLAGASLKFDTKIDNPAKKLAAKYTLSLGRQAYNGSLFMNSDKLIVSTEFMDLFKGLDQTSALTYLTLPDYIYLTGLAGVNIWDQMTQEELAPALQELVIFICEAIPEQYFELSPADNKVMLHIDQNGLPEIIHALMLKVLAEQDRFGSLVVNIETTLGFEVNQQENNQAIQEALKGLQEVVDNPDGIYKMLEMASIKLNFDLLVESSTLPAGPGKYLLKLGIDDPETLINVNLESSIKGSKENLTGTENVTFDVSDKAEGLSVNGKITQGTNLTTADYRSNSIIDLGISESNDEGSYLRLSLNGTNQYKHVKNVTINLPELTPTNSIDLIKGRFKPASYHEKVQVVLDGEVISFDVDPFIKENRTMVPLRNLAEKLGFTVVWGEPNQVIINNGDTTITMFLDEQTYTVNGTQKLLDVAPFETGGRTMVPVRFIAEELDCMVYYSETTNIVFINHKASTRIIPSHIN